MLDTICPLLSAADTSPNDRTDTQIGYFFPSSPHFLLPHCHKPSIIALLAVYTVR
jgi:hypothetical protein